MLRKKQQHKHRSEDFKILPEGDKDDKRCRRAACTDLLRQEGDDLCTDGVQPLGDLGLTGGKQRQRGLVVVHAVTVMAQTHAQKEREGVAALSVSQQNLFIYTHMARLRQ